MIAASTARAPVAARASPRRKLRRFNEGTRSGSLLRLSLLRLSWLQLSWWRSRQRGVRHQRRPKTRNQRMASPAGEYPAVATPLTAYPYEEVCGDWFWRISWGVFRI